MPVLFICALRPSRLQAGGPKIHPHAGGFSFQYNPFYDPFSITA
jgi:hypothetical protein